MSKKHAETQQGAIQTAQVSIGNLSLEELVSLKTDLELHGGPRIS